jgi:putative endonuclease
VYIMTNRMRTTLYTGVTSNLVGRVREHRDQVYPNSFTSRYKCFHLVYYECFHSIEEAIAREKQIKGGSRADKLELIKRMNPAWDDLFDKEVSSW